MFVLVVYVCVRIIFTLRHTAIVAIVNRQKDSLLSINYIVANYAAALNHRTLYEAYTPVYESYSPLI